MLERWEHWAADKTAFTPASWDSDYALWSLQETGLKVNQPASFAVQLNGARGVIDARVHTPSGAVEECYVSELDSGELALPLHSPASLGSPGKGGERWRLAHQASAPQISTPSASSPMRMVSTQLTSSLMAPTSLEAPSRSALASRAKLGTQAWCQPMDPGLREALPVSVWS